MATYNNLDPLDQFKNWYHHAEKAGLLRWFLSFIYPPAVLHQPDAMTLATATKDGKPSTRVVLFKGFKDDGFVFYTNYNSRKGKELAENPFAALVFYWGFPERQVRIEGSITKLSHDESCKYWNTRPRGSQISGLASEQSSLVPNREFLEKRVSELNQKYKGVEVPCPTWWGGYVLKPQNIEFWEGRINRLHDRICYERKGDGWQIMRLAP